jgi:hypothetical protein
MHVGAFGQGKTLVLDIQKDTLSTPPSCSEFPNLNIQKFMKMTRINFESFGGPSLPAPFSSDTPGEVWICGSVLFALQTNSKTVLETMEAHFGQKRSVQAKRCPFVLNVFNKIQGEPEPVLPIMIVYICYVDRLALDQQLVAHYGGTPSFREEPLGMKRKGLILLSVADALDTELRQIELPIDLKEARSILFDIAKTKLGLEKQPMFLGTLADGYGHASTGWPAKKGMGCLVVFGIFGIVALKGAAAILNIVT